MIDRTTYDGDNLDRDDRPLAPPRRICDWSERERQDEIDAIAADLMQELREGTEKGDWVFARLGEVTIDRAVNSWQMRDGGAELMTLHDLIESAARDCARQIMNQRIAEEA